MGDEDCRSFAGPALNDPPDGEADVILTIAPPQAGAGAGLEAGDGGVIGGRGRQRNN
jgi:hypothetical protein